MYKFPRLRKNNKNPKLRAPPTSLLGSARRKFFARRLKAQEIPGEKSEQRRLPPMSWSVTTTKRVYKHRREMDNTERLEFGLNPSETPPASLYMSKCPWPDPGGSWSRLFQITLKALANLVKPLDWPSAPGHMGNAMGLDASRAAKRFRDFLR